MTTPLEASVSVLGLGRMGAAMARALVDDGRPVTTWTRSGRSVEGAEPQADPAAAAAGSRNVLVSLFDATACREVLDAARSGLGQDQVVVNTSTVSPEEAVMLEDLVLSTGAAYVHAPVLGSVGAVSSGRLVVLAGSGDVDPPTDLLSSLGHVITVRGSSEAAAAKLMANGALATALHGTLESLSAAEDLKLDRSLALRVLEHTALGKLVAAKAQRLGDPSVPGADFTIGALTKDMSLLGQASRAGERIRAAWVDQVEQSVADAGDDIAAACRPQNHRREVTVDEDAHLTIEPSISVDAAVLAPLVAYAKGHATRDPRHFLEAFLPSSHVEGLRDGQFVSWALDEYRAAFNGTPAADEGSRTRHIDHVDVSESVASARMTLRHGSDTFTDVFLLLRMGETWHIANKAYHHHGN